MRCHAQTLYHIPAARAAAAARNTTLKGSHKSRGRGRRARESCKLRLLSPSPLASTQKLRHSSIRKINMEPLGFPGEWLVFLSCNCSFRHVIHSTDIDSLRITSLSNIVASKVLAMLTHVVFQVLNHVAAPARR